MTCGNIIRFAMAIVACTLIFCPSRGLGDEPKRVLIVHSYEKGQVCGQPQHDGLVKGLKEAGWKNGKNLKLFTFYMDTKKTYITPKQIAARGLLALQQVKTVKPDVVVTLDDNAARMVMLPLVGTDIPVVFSGMNGQPETYNATKHFMDSRKRPGGNVTGIYEKLHVVTSIKVVKGVLPDLKKVLAIIDRSPTGNAVAIQFEKELREDPPPVPCEIVRIKDFAEYQDLILNRVNTDPEIGAVYFVVLLVKDSNGKIYNVPKVLRWQITHCKKPSMAAGYLFSKMGLFGGAAVDYEGMGSQLTAKVVKILEGAKPGDLPIEDSRKYAIVFNTARAQELGIRIPSDILDAADYVYDTIGLKP